MSFNLLLKYKNLPIYFAYFHGMLFFLLLVIFASILQYPEPPTFIVFIYVTNVFIYLIIFATVQKKLDPDFSLPALIVMNLLYNRKLGGRCFMIVIFPIIGMIYDSYELKKEILQAEKNLH